MPESNQLTYLWGLITLLFGVFLQIVPLSEPLIYWRPQFVILVVFFWLFRNPFQFGIGFAWLAGLLLDIVIGELFGRHAIVFGLCAYLLQLLQQRLQHFWLFHQVVLVMLLVLLNQVLLHSITLMLRGGWQGELLVAPALTSALIWPFLVWLLSTLLKLQQFGRDMPSDH